MQKRTRKDQSKPAKKRGPDRRSNVVITFPLRLPGGEIIRQDRRASDRRRNAYISQLELCRGLDYYKIEAILERCPVVGLDTGEVLLNPGEPNHNLYLLLSGRLRVQLGATGLSATHAIEPGETVGEMSIIDGRPTSATVSADVPSRVLAVHESVFWSKIAAIPGAARNLLGTLAERMRRSNERALHSLEQELRYRLLEEELDAAREIQLGMLPASGMFSEFPTIDFHVYMGTAREVGGDFFDAFRLDDRRVCVAIGDVSGKGLPASLFMVKTMTLLRAELTKGDSLRASLARLNAALCRSPMAHVFVSLLVLSLDVSTGEVEYVSAGHNPPLAALQGKPFAYLEAEGYLVAGVLDDAEYNSTKLKLRPGDQLFLYTDGVTEARDEDRQFYGTGRLRDLLISLQGRSARDLVEAVRADVEGFEGAERQADDITILALGLRGG